MSHPSSSPRPAVKVLLFSDLQLDRPYPWAPADVAQSRRQAARDVLVKLLEEARERKVDVIACAGNLFNRRTVSPKSIRWLATVFRSAGVPVLLAPGSEDYVGPLGGYSRADWPDNVLVFEEDHLTPFEVRDGVKIWGAAHTEAHRRRAFFEPISTDPDELNLVLFHGTEVSALEREAELDPNAVFAEDDVTSSGFHHALVGRCREPHFGRFHTYPGSALPHDFATRTPGGGVVVTVTTDGSVQRELVETPSSPLHDLTVDVSGSVTEQDILAAVERVLSGRTGIVRLHLVGRLPLDVDEDVELTSIKVPGCTFQPVWETTIDADLEELAEEQTVRGEFARELLEANLSDQRKARLARIGLQALSGQETGPRR
jgi:DNA repair protein SbcD/Mre11